MCWFYRESGHFGAAKGEETETGKLVRSIFFEHGWPLNRQSILFLCRYMCRTPLSVSFWLMSYMHLLCFIQSRSIFSKQYRLQMDFASLVCVIYKAGYHPFFVPVLNLFLVFQKKKTYCINHWVEPESNFFFYLVNGYRNKVKICKFRSYMFEYVQKWWQKDGWKDFNLSKCISRALYEKTKVLYIKKLDLEHQHLQVNVSNSSISIY